MNDFSWTIDNTRSVLSPEDIARAYWQEVDQFGDAGNEESARNFLLGFDFLGAMALWTRREKEAATVSFFRRTTDFLATRFRENQNVYQLAFDIEAAEETESLVMHSLALNTITVGEAEQAISDSIIADSNHKLLLQLSDCIHRCLDTKAIEDAAKSKVQRLLDSNKIQEAGVETAVEEAARDVAREQVKTLINQSGMVQLIDLSQGLDILDQFMSDLKLQDPTFLLQAQNKAMLQNPFVEKALFNAWCNDKNGCNVPFLSRDWGRVPTLQSFKDLNLDISKLLGTFFEAKRSAKELEENPNPQGSAPIKKTTLLSILTEWTQEHASKALMSLRGNDAKATSQMITVPEIPLKPILGADEKIIDKPTVQTKDDGVAAAADVKPEPDACMIEEPQSQGFAQQSLFEAVHAAPENDIPSDEAGSIDVPETVADEGGEARKPKREETLAKPMKPRRRFNNLLSVVIDAFSDDEHWLHPAFAGTRTMSFETGLPQADDDSDVKLTLTVTHEPYTHSAGSGFVRVTPSASGHPI